jgi:hypothetical protein
MQLTNTQLIRLTNLLKWSKESLALNDLDSFTRYQNEIRLIASQIH